MRKLVLVALAAVAMGLGLAACSCKVMATDPVWRSNERAAPIRPADVPAGFLYMGVAGGYQGMDGGVNLSDALTGGLYAGYARRFGETGLAGVEVDYMLSDGDYLASVRGRVGSLHGPALLYVTAGAAFKDNIDVGVVVGGGIELELGKMTLVRFEALHYVFDDHGSKWWRADEQHTVARVGLGFRLN